MKSNPFISIVIANYNYGHLLSAALESIITQSCDDYEIIVVDGGSTDNSLEVIEKYKNYISWWVSEPDGGQSNAFNKGFSHAKGKFYTWLNADDILLPGTIEIVKRTFEKHSNVLWATGNFIRFLHDNGKITEAPWGPHILPSWLQGSDRIVVYFGPTTFWAKEIYEKVGPLDESLHYVMDVDYWYRINNAGYSQVRINHTCWGFRMHENSKTAEFEGHEKTDKSKIEILKEKRYIIEKNNYHPRKIWRILGLAMRIVDASIFRSLFNKVFLEGKKINEVYSINYNILLGK